MASEIPKVIVANRAIIRNDSDEILLVQRSLTDRNNPGLWEFPGGKLDTGEELDESMIREVFEETGLITIPKSGIGYVDHSYIREGPYKNTPFIAIFRAVHLLCGNLELSHEHELNAWVPAENITDFELTPQTRRAVSELRKVGLHILSQSNL